MVKFSVTYDTLYGGAVLNTETLSNEVVSEENHNDAVVNHGKGTDDVSQKNEYNAVVDQDTGRSGFSIV